MLARFLVACGLLFVCSTGLALACSCQAPPPPKAAMDQALAVFTGKVTAIEKAGDHHYQVSFDVALVWKGKPGAKSSVQTATSGAACGYAFQKDGEYLVYCYEDKEGNLRTNICSRTCPLADAARDLKALGPGGMPKE